MEGLHRYESNQVVRVYQRWQDGDDRPINQPWIDLPDELFRMIMNRLPYEDQVRARAVCKIWRAIDRVRPTNQLPKILLLDECKLFDPTYNKTYEITMDFWVNKGNLLLMASKNGWLLLREFGRKNPPYSLFLYCPMTEKVIKLPDLQSDFDVATFSNSPTSPDCVIFTLYFSAISDHSVFISTCRVGDKTWRKNLFNGGLKVNDIVYSQGIFYCSDSCGKLAIYNIAEDTWIIHGTITTVDPLQNKYTTYMVESDGDLLLVIMGDCMEPWTRIFKLDHSQMIWDKVENLGDRALFLGKSSFSVSDAKTIQGISNSIHYLCCYRRGCVFYIYDCSSGQFATCPNPYSPVANAKGKMIWI